MSQIMNYFQQNYFVFLSCFSSICSSEAAISKLPVSETKYFISNELTKRAEIIEIKRNGANIEIERLREKGAYFKKATG